MRLLTLLSILFSMVLLLACEGELPDDSCEANQLSTTGSAIINGEQNCYDRGALIYAENEDFLQLDLRGGRSLNFSVRASVPAEGFSFNVEYEVFEGEIDGGIPVTGGTLIIEEDNYPQDPSLLKYYGTYVLTFSDGSETLEVDGYFSFKRP